MKKNQMRWWEWGTGLTAIVVLALAGAFLLAPLVAGPTFDKIWPEVVKGLPAAFVALVIGMIAAGIAYRQMKIADQQRRVAADKLSFDLFKERYAIFEQTWSALSSGIAGAKDDELVPPELNRMNNSRPSAQFLFGPDIAAYLSEVSDKVVGLRMLHREFSQSSGPLGTDRLEELRALEAWVWREAQAGAKERFAPYLDFSRWRPGAG